MATFVPWRTADDQCSVYQNVAVVRVPHADRRSKFGASAEEGDDDDNDDDDD